MTETAAGAGRRVTIGSLARGTRPRAGKPQAAPMMRLHGGMLATPVLRYRRVRARGGRALTVILNSHLGTRVYFDTIRQRVAALEAGGAAAQWEGIRDAPAGEWAAATEPERAARQVMITLYRDMPRAMARGLGWVWQGDALPDVDSQADLTDLDVIRAAGPGGILAMGLDNDKLAAKLGRHWDRYLAVTAPIRFRALARPGDRVSQAVAQQHPDVYQVLLQQRSRMAVDAVGPGTPGRR